MVKKKHKYTKKTKGRMLIIFLFFGTIIFTLGYTLFNNLQQINSMSNQKKRIKKRKNIFKRRTRITRSRYWKIIRSWIYC